MSNILKNVLDLVKCNDVKDEHNLKAQEMYHQAVQQSKKTIQHNEAFSSIMGEKRGLDV